MRHVFLATATLLTVAACAQFPIFAKEEAVEGPSGMMLTDCRIQSAAEPGAAQPGLLVPVVQEICDANGNCAQEVEYMSVAEDSDTQIASGSAKALCASGENFVEVLVPACSTELAQSTPQGRSSVVGALSAQSCAVANSDGSFLIVERPKDAS